MRRRAVGVTVSLQAYGVRIAGFGAGVPERVLSELGLMKDRDVLTFVAFGAGLSWGAIAWRWDGAPACGDATA